MKSNSCFIVHPWTIMSLLICTGLCICGRKQNNIGQEKSLVAELCYKVLYNILYFSIPRQQPTVFKTLLSLTSKFIELVLIFCCHALCNYTENSESWVIHHKIWTTSLLRYPVEYWKSELNFFILFRCFKVWNERSSILLCTTYYPSPSSLWKRQNPATISIMAIGFCNETTLPSRQVLVSCLLLKINHIPINRENVTYR